MTSTTHTSTPAPSADRGPRPAEPAPRDSGAAVLLGVLRGQRRTLPLWALALAAVSAMYVSFYPSIGGADMESLIANLPDGVVSAMGYDRIGTPSGYLTSTVYGLLAPVLLLVFAVSWGARLIAGEEESGALELELTAPVSRRRVYLERLAALVLDVLILVTVLTVAVWLLVTALSIDVAVTGLLAGGVGLLLVVLGFGTIALAVGAATGRRGAALGVAAGLAVLAFVLDAIGPTVDQEWMTAVSPFSWFLASDPLLNGFAPGDLALLAVVPVVAGLVGLTAFTRRDLMV